MFPIFLKLLNLSLINQIKIYKRGIPGYIHTLPQDTDYWNVAIRCTNVVSCKYLIFFFMIIIDNIECIFQKGEKLYTHQGVEKRPIMICKNS